MFERKGQLIMIKINEFLLSVLHTFLSFIKDAARDYAQYCLRSFWGILGSGEGTGFVPSIEEARIILFYLCADPN